MPIIESDAISIVADHLCSKSLLILDLDNTLIQSASHYGSYQWGGYLIREALKGGLQEEHAIDLIMPQWNQAQYLIEVKTLEEKISSFIEELHLSGVQLLALTARCPEIANVTLKHLNQHQIKFSDWSPFENYFRAHPQAHLEGGVLFVGPKSNKGHFLGEFINLLKDPLRKVVFVDDQIGYLKEAQKILEPTPIEFLGVQYTRANSWVKSFDINTAKAEEMKFKAQNN